MATVDIEQAGPILWLRLDRPEAMNAYNAAMGASLPPASAAPTPTTASASSC